MDLLKIHYSVSYQGDRDENLDRFGHIEGKNWSFSYVLDGFEISDPHYVDSLVERLEDMKNHPKLSSKEDILKKLNQAIEYDHKHCGKASVAFIVCVDGKMTCLTAGDTRVYRLKSQERTLDHSQAQHLVSQGKAPANTINRHPLRKYLRKKLQNGSDISEISISEHDVTEDVLLCSDGVWSCFDNDNDIYSGINAGGESLFTLALENRIKNRDNMTLLHLKAC